MAGSLDRDAIERVGDAASDIARVVAAAGIPDALRPDCATPTR